MKNNFTWQFDPSFFINTIGADGTTKASNIHTQLSSFMHTSVSDYYKSMEYGAAPSSILPGSDVDDFGELLALIVNQVQEYEGVAERDRIEVREDYQDIAPTKDVITWCLNKRVPGLYGQGKPGNSHVQEFTMHLRRIDEDEYQPGQAIATFGQKMDNWIALTVNSADARSANRRVLWLEHIMDQSRWIFQYNGFERVLFDRRTEDQFKDVNSNPCYKRTLIYYVRTEKIVLHRTALLKKLFFDLCLVPPGFSINKESAKK